MEKIDRKLRLEIFTEGKIKLPFHGVNPEFFRKAADRIANILCLEKVSMSLILTDDAYIQEINRDYRQKDMPTDVISFAYRDNPFPGIELEIEELGDIYISLEKALGQADEYNVTFENELKRLMVHGTLHLLGYDHEKTEDEAREMEKKEDEILSSLL